MENTAVSKWEWVSCIGNPDKLKAADIWTAAPNLATPIRFSENFDSDDGHLAEERNRILWK